MPSSFELEPLMALRMHTASRSNRTRASGSARVPLVGLAVVLLALAAALILWLRHEPAGSDPSSIASTASIEVGTSRLDSSPSAHSERRAEEFDEQATAASLASAVDGDHAEIRGRFVLADGSPVSRVPIQLTAGIANGARTRAQGATRAWSGEKTISDEHGRFSIVFVPSRALEYDLRATPEGLCPVHWSWQLVEPGERKDLGDIVLSKGGAIAGRMLDAQGQPLLGQEWKIHAEQPWSNFASGFRPNEDPCLSDKSTGAFRLNDVVPGLARLCADHGGMCRFEGPIVDVRSGETVHADLTCPDASATSRISVVVTCPPYMPGPYRTADAQQVTGIHLEGAGRSLSPSPPDRLIHGFSFDHLAPGQYTVRIDDPRYVPWTSAPVEPGALVEAQLKGSSSVRLTVVDDVNGPPITRCSVHADVHDPYWQVWASAFLPLLEDGDLTRTDGVIDGLVPIAQTLIVSAPGYADTYVRGVILNEGEVLPLNVRMSKGATLSGRVLAGDGRTPAGDAIVRLEMPFSQHRSLDGMLEDKSGVQVTKADSVTGRFAFPRLVPGRYHVQASTGAAVHSPIVEARADDDAQEVELRLPPMTRLRGRILAPAGASFANTRLLLECKAFPGTSQQYGIVGDLGWRQRLSTPIAPDGHYESGSLPTGEARVTLITPDVDLPHGFAGAGQGAGSTIDLGTLMLTPEEWNEHDFDLRTSFFGAIRISLELDRRSAAGCVVTACTVEERYLHTIAGAMIDRDDSVELGPIAPGDYAIVVTPPDAGWNWVGPGLVHVNSAAVSSESYRIELAADVLRVGVQGEPDLDLTNRFSVRLDAPFPVSSTRLEPAADGTVRLEMPVGRYILRFITPMVGREAGTVPVSTAPPRKDPTIPFDWPIPSGGTRELVFPRRD
jgi:hypothetical protein